MQLTDCFKDFTLTSDQQGAIEKINNFLSGSSEALILKGYAGTGKTFLAAGVVRYLQAAQRTFVLMAPTGRAAMIIGSKTGMEAFTIHRAIYDLSEIDDDETSFRFMYKSRINNDSLSTVYIVDESSMISDVHQEDEFFVFGSGLLLTDLINYIGFDHRKGAKVIFMGDYAQIPPVDMNFSPALDKDYISSHFKISVEECELSETVRQEHGSNILSFATQLRSSLVEKKFNNFKVPKTAQEIIRETPASAIDDYFKITGGNPVTDTMIITFSNRQALDYNLQIRKRFFGSAVIDKNDILIQTRNNYNYPIDLYNGMFVKVVETAAETEKREVTFFIKGGEKKSVTHTFRDVVIEAYNSKGDMFVIGCKLLDNFLTSAEGRLDPYGQRALYIDFKKRHPHLKPRTTEFRHELMTDKYFNALQVKFGYAITCHKAQGGEWNNVFVDFKVNSGKLTSGYFRWSYTAVTRAKMKLYAIDPVDYGPLSEFIIKPCEKISKVLSETYFMPEISIDDSDDEKWKQFTFLKSKYMFIHQRVDSYNITLSVKHNSWVERYLFSSENKSVTIDLIYGSGGFTGKYNIISSSDKNLEELCLSICKQKPVYNFEYKPANSFQSELYQYISEVAGAIGLRITNIVNQPFLDRYFFETEAECSLLDFFYLKTGVYTSVIPKSTMGVEDKKLSTLISALQLEVCN